MPTIALQYFLKDESGATAIEYGLIAALVSVASIVALQVLGRSLNSIFGVVSSELHDTASQANNP
jgi:pilus assembly protein Flp/PilA